MAPVAHLEQVLPPQSTSLSVPLRVESVHVGARHVPLVQTPEPQSAFAVHFLPSAQGPQEPPQSTSVSVPFFTPSLHATGGLESPLTTMLSRSALSQIELALVLKRMVIGPALAPGRLNVAAA